MMDKEFVELKGPPRIYRKGVDSYGVLVGKRFYEFTPTGHLSDMGKITPELLGGVTGEPEKGRGFSAAAAAIRKNMEKRPDIGEDDGKQRQRSIPTSREARTNPHNREPGK
jgi:hypothetical protein